MKKAIEETDDYISGKNGSLDFKPLTSDPNYDAEADEEFDSLFGGGGDSSPKKMPKISKKRPPTPDSDNSSTTGSSKPKKQAKKKNFVDPQKRNSLTRKLSISEIPYSKFQAHFHLTPALSSLTIARFLIT